MKRAFVLVGVGAAIAALLAMFARTTGVLNVNELPNIDGLSARTRVVSIAESQLGVSDPSAYWLDAYGDSSAQLNRLAWCGIFGLWVLRQARLTSRRWVLGRGFIFTTDEGAPCVTAWLPTTVNPLPGDLAYFDKPYQHFAIVQDVENGTAFLIAGNTPNVGRQQVQVSSPRVRFFSIAKLVGER